MRRRYGQKQRNRENNLPRAVLCQWKTYRITGISAGASACGGNDCGVCDTGDYCSGGGRAFSGGLYYIDTGGFGDVGADHVSSAVSYFKGGSGIYRFRASGDHGHQFCLCAHHAGHCRGAPCGSYTGRTDYRRRCGGACGGFYQTDPQIFPAVDCGHSGICHRAFPVPYCH